MIKRTAVGVLVTVFSVRAQSSLGTFAEAGNLTTQRMFHTATLLANGKVLVAGGWALLAGWPVWASAELYDHSTQTFSPTGSMSIARSGHTATLLPDGRVLIVGGQTKVAVDLASAVPSLASAEIYDPIAGTFTPTGAMTTGRANHTATLLANGKVLITGGMTYDSMGNEPFLASAELYDPATGSFTAAGNMASVRAGHQAVLLTSGKVLVLGGNSCGNTPNPEVYDPAKGAFSLTGPPAYPMALGPVSTSIMPNGNVLDTLSYGCDFAAQAEVYSSSLGTFSPTGNMTTIRGYSTATLLPEGRVLIDGRADGYYGGSSEIYDPATGAFTATVGEFPQSEEGHTATLLADGSVLIAGGWICCGFSVATAELYFPAILTPSPVLYTMPGGDAGAILHGTTQQLVSTASPAAAGETIEIYASGLSEGSVVAPQVSIGGREAQVAFFGDAPGFPGLNQINVTVPSGLASGTNATVEMLYLSRPTNSVTIAIQ
jgi:hypothetical protein